MIRSLPLFPYHTDNKDITFFRNTTVISTPMELLSPPYYQFHYWCYHHCVYVAPYQPPPQLKIYFPHKAHDYASITTFHMPLSPYIYYLWTCCYLHYLFKTTSIYAIPLFHWHSTTTIYISTTIPSHCFHIAIPLT